jgi:hypothetical protein
MTLIQHSSESNCWGTPIDIIERSRIVLGGIHFDPASDEQFNQNVKANFFMTKEENALLKTWPLDCNAPMQCSIFLNPPGGKTGRDSNMVLFWRELMKYQYNNMFGHAIFVAFSLEALQTTQQCDVSIANFPMCFPKRRLRFIDENCREGGSPSHGNVIVYVPGHTDRTALFRHMFNPVGAVVIPDR